MDHRPVRARLAGNGETPERAGTSFDPRSRRSLSKCDPDIVSAGRRRGSRHRGAIVHDLTNLRIVIVPKLPALLLSAVLLIPFQSARALQPPVITYASVVGSS